MLKDDEIIEELDKKYKIIQKKGGYKGGYGDNGEYIIYYLQKEYRNESFNK